jgi:Flp pilus assembly protein TadG
MTRHPKTPESDTVRRRFWRNKGGNIALITALVMIPLTFAVGMAFDFTLSQTRKDQLDGIADAAALGAVTPAMMNQLTTVAQAQSTSLFEGQEASVKGVVPVAGAPPVVPTVTVNDVDTSAATVTRSVTVSYVAQSQNVFASLLGMPTLPIHGSSTATAATAPNINFYLLLDTSPSMEIAATTTGIAQLESLTTAQQPLTTPTTYTPAGCAFGCHETNPTSGDVAGNPGGEDNYTLAHNNGIALRSDLVTTATVSLMSTAQTTAATFGAAYKVAIDTFDVSFRNVQALTPDLSSAATTAAGITPLVMYSNNQLTKSDDNNDEDTDIDGALTAINTSGSAIFMPTPGGGTNNPGDTPQEVLFIVTDGLNDKAVSGNRVYLPMDATGSLCTAIKNRGIRIAVLYTVYFPIDTQIPATLSHGQPAPCSSADPHPPYYNCTWYDEYINPLNASGVAPSSNPLANISPDALACASPGLFYAVSTDGDITTALQTLFQEAVQQARLSH